jgi:hypothetical protein
MRARTLALMDACQLLRLESAQRQRESLRLRDACEQAGHACRASVERSKARRQPRILSDGERLDMAYLLAKAISALGLPAFVVEPSRDSALEA